MKLFSFQILYQNTGISAGDFIFLKSSPLFFAFNAAFSIELLKTKEPALHFFASSAGKAISAAAKDCIFPPCGPPRGGA